MERHEDESVTSFTMRRIIHEAVAKEREACAQIAEDQIKAFASDEYSMGQPLASFGERFASGHIAELIRGRGADG